MAEGGNSLSVRSPVQNLRWRTRATFFISIDFGDYLGI